MRPIRKIVHHCSAARPDQAARQTAADIDRMHRERGWRKIGYHFFIRFDGTIEAGRPIEEIGSGVLGHNKDSIHICYAGGLDQHGRPADTRSGAQIAAQAELTRNLKKLFPSAEVLGHRDLSPDTDGDGKVEQHEWLKDCPCFDVRAWWSEAGRGSVS